MIRHVLAAGVLCLAGGPALSQETPEALLEAFIAAVEAEDAQALGALYLEDADSYTPGTNDVHGRAAIAADWAGFFEAFDEISIAIETQGEAHEGDMHAAWGLWSLTQTPAGGGEAFTMTGRFTDVQRWVDERWYYIVDHASVSPAGPAQEEE